MVSFKMFAGTDIGLRENNEDNFTVCPDLTLDEWIVPAEHQQAIPLGKKGCIMVVADGMGGQNAGEVASAIAVDTVQEMFSSANMPGDVVDKPDSIKNYLKNVIVEADARVKSRSKEDVEANGMGSTIIIAWIIETKAYIAWLGDSRAYSYIQEKGIARISKDHSYVQQLVDAGALTEDEAMVHPNSNIITRSLGDISQKAKVDVAEYSLENGEVILLCSDGLCGFCKDDEIGGIIEDELPDLQKCKDKLTTAALSAGGSDNITIALLQVFIDEQQEELKVEAQKQSDKSENKVLLRSKIRFWLLGIFMLFCLCFTGYALFPKDTSKQDEKNKEVKASSHKVPGKKENDTAKKKDELGENTIQAKDPLSLNKGKSMERNKTSNKENKDTSQKEGKDSSSKGRYVVSQKEKDDMLTITNNN